jgi:hypothetical protein
VAAPLTLILDRPAGRLLSGAGQSFDLATRTWQPGAPPSGGRAVTVLEALAWLQRESGRPCRVPVGVVGPREPSPAQFHTAEALGRALAELGLTVLCGGRSGVMEAVCQGVAAAGGISVGLLPDAEPEAANPHVTIPIATGIGIARNAIIARAALCLVAVGSGLGTTAEVALGLQFGKAVFGLEQAPAVQGIQLLPDVAAATDAVAHVALSLPWPP